ncbi:hypothetical protein BH10BDE1_BH10BDE1_16050 [soil metagenome]
MKFSKCARTISSFAILWLAVACTNPLSGGSSVIEGAFNPGAPGAPTAQNFAATFNQDTDSQALVLPYTADLGVLSVSCTISNLLNVTIAQACSCAAGVCTVKARGTTFYSGSAGFQFVLVDGEGRQSNTGLAALTIVQTNQAPTLALIADRSTNEDTPAVVVMTPADSDGALTCTTANFTVTSSNQTLVPNGSLALSGAWPGCQLTATPALNLAGTTTISVTLSDGIQSAARSFVLTVDPVNDAPTISNVLNLSTNEDTATAAIPFTIADVDSTLSCATSVTATSSNTTLVPNVNISLGGAFPNCTATIAPAANQNGTSTITLTVSDGTLTANDTFVLTVTAVDDAPVVPGAGTSPTINQCAATPAGSIPIALTYDDVDGDQATACAVSAISSSLQGTAACTCTAGACKVNGLTPTTVFLNSMTTGSDQDILTAITYTVTANGLTSASGSTKVTVKTGTWTPNCFGTNLALWLDASDTATLFSDTAGTTAAVSGDAIALWKDKSTNGRNASQSTLAARPIFSATGFNTRAGVTSDGVDDQIDQIGTSSVLPSNSNFLHVFASRFLDGSGALFDWSTSDYHAILMDHLTYGLLVGAGNAWIGVSGPNTVKPFGTRGAANSASIGTLSRVSSGTEAMYVNGSTTASRSAASATMTNGRFRFFGRLPTVQYAKIELGEYVFVSYGASAIDATARARLEGYLAYKWGMVANLPAGHAYKSYAP